MGSFGLNISSDTNRYIDRLENKLRVVAIVAKILGAFTMFNSLDEPMNTLIFYSKALEKKGINFRSYNYQSSRAGALPCQIEPLMKNQTVTF